MPTAVFNGEEVEVYTTRYKPIIRDLYDADGETPLVITALDNVRFKVWATDGTTPAIECQSLVPGSGSYVAVTTIGSAGVTPARIVIHLLQADTTTLTVGTQYYGEVILIDQSDGSKAKPLGRFPIRVVGTAAGSVAL